MIKCLPAMQETRVQFLGWEDPLEKETATHSSTLAWKIPWTGEPGRLQSRGVTKSRTRLSDFIHGIRGTVMTRSNNRDEGLNIVAIFIINGIFQGGNSMHLGICFPSTRTEWISSFVLASHYSH